MSQEKSYSTQIDSEIVAAFAVLSLALLTNRELEERE
jgi:hypothetical protein